jgi:hypothetical protein
MLNTNTTSGKQFDKRMLTRQIKRVSAIPVNAKACARLELDKNDRLVYISNYIITIYFEILSRRSSHEQKTAGPIHLHRQLSPQPDG